MSEKYDLPKAPSRTTPGFAFSMIDRALTECLGERRFGKAEIDSVLAYFNTGTPECVYCGSQDVKRWDHLIPVKNGGETVLGNMVPACAHCDDSKRDLSLEDWMLGNAPQSPKSRGVADVEQRVERIRTYMNRFGYQKRSLEERLTFEERERLGSIRDSIQHLKEEMDRFINGYQARNLNKP
jgi:hypothetical protein